MKKFIALLFVMLFSAAVFAQTKDYTEIKVSALPKNTTDWIKKNMPQGTIVKAAVGNENNQKIYFAQVEVKGDKRLLRFDKDGNFLGKGTKDRDTAKPVPLKTSQPTSTDQKKQTTEPAKK